MMDASDFETAYDMLFTTIGECYSWIYKNLLQLNLYVYVYMYSTKYYNYHSVLFISFNNSCCTSTLPMSLAMHHRRIPAYVIQY